MAVAAARKPRSAAFEAMDRVQGGRAKLCVLTGTIDDMLTKPTPSLDALLESAAGRIGRNEARLLMAHALQKPAAWLFAHGDEALPSNISARFDALVQARAAGEPIAYLTGRRSFWTLDLRVTPDTLVPRPETELLVELALARLPMDVPCAVADLGTGSGAIALAIARERPRAHVIATDASTAALQVARANARDHGIGNVEFRQGSWYSPLHGQRCDLIASNPPYISEGDPHLSQGDLRFEPPAALASGSDGLDAIREIVGKARIHLFDMGWLLLEHGWEQGASVRGLLEAAGFQDVASACDLEHRERVSFGRTAAG